MVIKTDRKDARGIAQLLRMGWFRPVHAKSPGAQEVRALLIARKLLQTKMLDVEFSIRGHSARVRAEDGRDEQGAVCGSGPRLGGWASRFGAHRRPHVSGTLC